MVTGANGFIGYAVLVGVLKAGVRTSLKRIQNLLLLLLITTQRPKYSEVIKSSDLDFAD